mmetsp:Transcript_37936/g.122053  ORF Transcript_37936/g.122053 Transcript_37936/m.122053 type:complete len:295 (-) Transcript_37936:108-992(-)
MGTGYHGTAYKQSPAALGTPTRSAASSDVSLTSCAVGTGLCSAATVFAGQASALAALEPGCAPFRAIGVDPIASAATGAVTGAPGAAPAAISFVASPCVGSVTPTPGTAAAAMPFVPGAAGSLGTPRTIPGAMPFVAFSCAGSVTSIHGAVHDATPHIGVTISANSRLASPACDRSPRASSLIADPLATGQDAASACALTTSGPVATATSASSLAASRSRVAARSAVLAAGASATADFISIAGSTAASVGAAVSTSAPRADKFSHPWSVTATVACDAGGWRPAEATATVATPST